MWIESGRSFALCSDGSRAVASDQRGCHVWSLETGEVSCTLWEGRSDFHLAPHDRAVVRELGLELAIHDLDGRQRADIRARFRGFSRDGTQVFSTPMSEVVHAIVTTLDAMRLGRLGTGLHRRPGNAYHPAMDDMTYEEILACSGGSSVSWVHELHEFAWISTSGQLEVWTVEPPVQRERDRLPPDPRSITIGPRHIVVGYDRGLLVRPRS